MKKMKKMKKPKSEVSLELVGVVNVVEREQGKRAKRTPIEGELVLKALISVISDGLDIIVSTKTRPCKSTARNG
jgi:hypothetical protein